jgi:PleD family two-component response regulator
MAPQTSISEAESLAKRLCSNLAGGRVAADGVSVGITGSFGVTRYRLGEDIDACLKRTDNALYEAKTQGRNRIVVNTMH